MRKIIISLLILLLLLSSCGRYIGEEMLTYYQNEENYLMLEGEIVEKYKFDSGYQYVDVKVLTNTYDEEFYLSSEQRIRAFALYSNIELIDEMEVGDKIAFLTAPDYFYDGYMLPFLSITVNGTELLALEDGKAGIIKWINTTWLED